MHVLLAVFFLGVSSMVKVHGKHPVALSLCFYWVACVGANEPLVAPVPGWASLSFLFLIFAHARRRQDKP